MNKVFLIGRLTKDPVLQTTPDGIHVCKFTLAVNRNFRGSDGKSKADFLNVVVWRNQAKACGEYLKKGSQCAVEGSIQVNTFDGQDGTRRYMTDVVADQVEFLARAGEGGSGGGAIEGGGYRASSSSGGDDLEPITDDDVPF